MTTLPIPDLLAEVEILALEAMDFGAQLAHFPAQVLHQSNQLRRGVAWATELNQWAIHSQHALPKKTRMVKKWLSFHYERERWMAGSAKLY
jgi:hypothetical protein